MWIAERGIRNETSNPSFRQKFRTPNSEIRIKAKFPGWSFFRYTALYHTRCGYSPHLIFRRPPPKERL